MEAILFEHEVSLSRILQAEAIRSDEVQPPLHPPSLIRHHFRRSSSHPSLSSLSLSLSIYPLQLRQLEFCTKQPMDLQKGLGFFCVNLSSERGNGTPARRKKRRDREIEKNKTWETRRERETVGWFCDCI